MDPNIFDCLLEKLGIARVFHNQSTYLQMSVYKQVYIVFKKSDVYGTGIAVTELTDRAEVKYDKVDLITHQVIQVVFQTNLRTRHIRWSFWDHKIQPKDWTKTATTLWVSKKLVYDRWNCYFYFCKIELPLASFL